MNSALAQHLDGDGLAEWSTDLMQQHRALARWKIRQRGHERWLQGEGQRLARVADGLRRQAQEQRARSETRPSWEAHHQADGTRRRYQQALERLSRRSLDLDYREERLREREQQVETELAEVRELASAISGIADMRRAAGRVVAAIDRIRPPVASAPQPVPAVASPEPATTAPPSGERRFSLLDLLSDAEIAADKADRRWQWWQSLDDEQQRTYIRSLGIGCTEAQ